MEINKKNCFFISGLRELWAVSSIFSPCLVFFISLLRTRERKCPSALSSSTVSSYCWASSIWSHNSSWKEIEQEKLERRFNDIYLWSNYEKEMRMKRGFFLERSQWFCFLKKSLRIRDIMSSHIISKVTADKIPFHYSGSNLASFSQYHVISFNVG